MDDVVVASARLVCRAWRRMVGACLRGTIIPASFHTANHLAAFPAINVVDLRDVSACCCFPPVFYRSLSSWQHHFRQNLTACSAVDVTDLLAATLTPHAWCWSDAISDDGSDDVALPSVDMLVLLQAASCGAVSAKAVRQLPAKLPGVTHLPLGSLRYCRTRCGCELVACQRHQSLSRRVTALS